jgi:ABC-type polysaccharide/polyol phosphate transport system ATPase subunit
MASPAIRVEGLGKRYRLAHGQEREQYRTLRDSIMRFISAPLRKRGTVEEFWALADVSFDVQPGEVVGIIGRNGAGKSTLLKILSRITKPTTGRVEINGRVGSLLEVGTGFHPELTGRENVYLNGSILGMSRTDIAKKFDEIVAYAEVEKFLDTPLKRYSSGMSVRLAFAVAAHLEPEILIIDEVLAVGDAQFQKKCLDRLQECARSGATVFFVSHQISALKRLCTSAILLDRGKVIRTGPKAEIIAQYLASASEQTLGSSWLDLRTATRVGAGYARFAAVRYSEAMAFSERAVSDGPFNLDLILETTAHYSSLRIAASIYDRYGTKLINLDSLAVGRPFYLTPGENAISIRLERLHLKPGKYVLGLWLADPSNVVDHLAEAAQMEVIESPESSTQAIALDNGDGVVTGNFDITRK